jgi:hypothetical protein
VTLTLHDDRVSCPHCDAEYVTEPDLALIGADAGHAAYRRRPVRPAEALRLFGSLRRKLQ